MSAPTAEIGHNSRIPAFAPFFEKLDELKAKDADAAFDYEDEAGNKAARSHVHKLRLEKGEVERARKKEKEESIAYGRRVDEQAKAVIEAINKLIAPHENALREIEQREKDRIAAHEKALEDIERMGQEANLGWSSLTLDEMNAMIAKIDDLAGREWEEFAIRFDHASAANRALIRESIARREAHDAEQAEQERQRREEEERQRQEREAQIAREAEERAKAEAEAKAREEREASERREQELKDAAERERQRAERAAKETEDRLAREAKEKAEREAKEAAEREADKKHRGEVNSTAAAAFVAGGLTEDAARLAVTLIAKKAVPAVTITY